MDFASILGYYADYALATQTVASGAAQRANPSLLAQLPGGRLLPSPVGSTALPDESVLSGAVENTQRYVFTLQAASPSGSLTSASATTPFSGQTVAQLTLSPYYGKSSGFAQQANYEFRARQTVQQSMAGFVVDEFDMAPGRITLDLLVIVVPGIPSLAGANMGFDQFTQLLYRAKGTDPSYAAGAPHNPSPPMQLLFQDVARGWVFKISQSGLDIQQTVDAPFLARLRMDCAIIVDYQQPVAANPIPSSPPVGSVTGSLTPGSLTTGTVG